MTKQQAVKNKTTSLALLAVWRVLKNIGCKEIDA